MSRKPLEQDGPDKSSEWRCPVCGETASGPEDGVQAVAERHTKKTGHGKKGNLK